MFSGNFLFGLIVGIALMWAYRKFGGLPRMGGGKSQ